MSAITPTPGQNAAIAAPLGPVLVIAGPGAGKTFCLIERVNYLIAQKGMRPERILAVTFTNKAAEEIALRLSQSLGQVAQDVTRSTLHAACLRILREYGEALGLVRGFGIADEGYQHAVLRKLRIPRRRWSQVLLSFSRRRLQRDRLPKHDEALFQKYLAYLRDQSMLDFDDLISSTADLFERHPDIADDVAERWDYLLVDEFQDLNETQYTILRRLAARHCNFFAVGDDEQSIFSWTGADPAILRRFVRDYELDAPIVLDKNMRCSRQIFDAARRLLENNTSLFDKGLSATRESAYDVTAHSFEDEDAEAYWILNDIVRDKQETGGPWGDYGILYRQHRVGDYLEQVLVKNTVPCRMAHGRALQDDPVIAYVVASLRLIASPNDPTNIEACAAKVLPDQLMEQVRTEALSNDSEFFAALRRFARSGAKDHPDTKRAWRFIYHVENLPALAQSHRTLSGLVEELLAQRVGKYRNVLEDRHAELSDPATQPAVTELAERLTGVAAGSGRVLVEPCHGVEIGVRGMLMAMEFSTLDPDSTAGLRPADLKLSGDSAGELGLPLIVFKALQLMHSREFGDILQDYVAFDFETTDRDATTCEIIEIGAVKVRSGQIVDRFRSLVKSGQPISAGAREVHGYTDDDLADAPSFTEVWPKFREFIGTDILVAHNGHSFDVPVLRRAAAGLPGLNDLVFFDTLPLARSLFRRSAKLEQLADNFGIDKGRAHHALDDAETLARVFLKLNEQKKVRARKAALVNLLDYLGLGLALDSRTVQTAEHELLLELARPFVLGRYSECLEFYSSERDRLRSVDLPSLAEVIDRLGGRKLMDRIRAERSAAERYPQSLARLEALMDGSRSQTIEEHIESFLERIALSTSEGADVDRNRVNLLTLHSTKGLEFSRVYVVGVEDYQLPGYYQSIDNQTKEIDEARRLLYVGMTRAADRLVLTRVARRLGKDAGGNRFLDEMGIEIGPATADR
ncbi:MAG: UvrD-helicase domain-containing protein [Gemmatimonadales bacterium]